MTGCNPYCNYPARSSRLLIFVPHFKRVILPDRQRGLTSAYAENNHGITATSEVLF